jgi:Phosphoribosyl-ATP pyrophosphohydrolase
MKDTLTLKDALYKLYEDSKKCCIIAGQITETSDLAKRQQLKLIQEEVKELQEAIESNDPTEQLDAIADILVTTFGFMLKLERQGANTSKAFIKTGANNLTKFPVDRDTVEATLQFYKDKGVECTSSFDPVYNQWVVRDMNGKYKKPKGFIENDLSDCWN